MNAECGISAVLRFGSLLGVAAVAIGLLMYLLGIGHGILIMTAGIATVVFTPFAGLIASLATFSVNKERTYASAAAVLTATVLAGMIIAFCIG